MPDAPKPNPDNRGPEGTMKISSADAPTITATPSRTPTEFMPRPQPDFSGLTLGGYQLVRKIAEGGMGVVYEALQTKLSRRVALKVLNEHLAAKPEFLHRFEREAKAAAALNHPNIVQVYDFIEAEGRHCLILEFIDGEDLSAFIAREGKFSVAEALGLIEQAAQALKFACSKSIIHRDIKPSNLMFTSDRRVKVSDLGLAKILTEDSDLTMTSASLGSPHYMAPEQASDAAKVDHRVDIYALGITLLYLLTGRRPYDGNTPYTIVLGHINKPLPTGAELGTRLPPAVEALIKNMAAKDPDARYQSYDALLADLERAKAGFAPTVKAPSHNFANKWITIAAAVAIVAMAVGTALLVLTKKNPPKTKEVVTAQSPSSTTPVVDTENQRRMPPPREQQNFGNRDFPPEGQQDPGFDQEQFPPPDMQQNGTGMRMPMGPPPKRQFITIPQGSLESMLSAADQYASLHATNYAEILDAYNQVKQAAGGTGLEPQVDRRISSAYQAMQKAVTDTVQQYQARMDEKLRAGKPQEAFDVWKTFPGTLRSREVDERIRNILQRAMSAGVNPPPER